jgi:hypothetical protein
MEGGEIMRKISDIELEELLADQKLFSKDTQLKVSAKEFEFTLFGRTFRFETYVKHTKPVNMFAPVEPCETSSRLAAVFCKTPSPPYTDEDIIRYREQIAEHKETRKKLKEELPIPGVPPNYDGHSHSNRFD